MSSVRIYVPQVKKLGRRCSGVVNCHSVAKLISEVLVGSTLTPRKFFFFVFGGSEVRSVSRLSQEFLFDCRVSVGQVRAPMVTRSLFLAY